MYASLFVLCAWIIVVLCTYDADMDHTTKVVGEYYVLYSYTTSKYEDKERLVRLVQLINNRIEFFLPH